MRKAPMKTLVALLLALCVSGCLFRKDVPARWFQPESTLLADRADTTPDRGGRPVRLRSVQAIAFLRERMAWRLPPVESGLYEQRRWREMPATYVERALTAALAHTPGVRLTDDVRAPALRVEVLAFDEVVGPTHAALVKLEVTLRDGDRTLLERTFSSEQSAQGADSDGVATAMGAALDAVAGEVATAVAGSLSAARR
jgi:ABC-type uncharacterized transport system auxiliary subunit